MANEKETPESKKTSDQPSSESEEKKPAPKKKSATPKKKTQGKPKTPKTEPVAETAGTEEVQPQDSGPSPETPADEPEPAEATPSTNAEAIPAVPSAEPPEAGGGTSDASPPPPPQEPESDPLKTFGLYAGAAFLILIVLIVGASMQNMGKYYVISRDGAVEIWKGKFSPMGRERLLVMPGSQPLDSAKEVYTKQDVYPLIFQYNLNKADALMDVSGSPNFEDIKAYLNRASQYATTAEMRDRVQARIQTIDRLTLLYKADVAASRGTTDGYRNALAFLQQAQTLNPDEIEANLIQEKIQSIQKQMDALDQTSAAAKEESPGPEADESTGGEGRADQQSTAPQSPESGKSSSEQAGSAEKPVDF